MGTLIKFSRWEKAFSTSFIPSIPCTSFTILFFHFRDLIEFSHLKSNCFYGRLPHFCKIACLLFEQRITWITYLSILFAINYLFMEGGASAPLYLCLQTSMTVTLIFSQSRSHVTDIYRIWHICSSQKNNTYSVFVLEEKGLLRFSTTSLKVT